MKKNFLLLFLMALLPLAGWAATGDFSWSTAPATTYDGTEKALPSPQEEDRTVVVMKWEFKKPGASTWTEVTNGKYKNAGTYKVTYEVNETGASTTHEFVVAKCALNITAKSFTGDDAIAYGDDAPEAEYDYTVTGYPATFDTDAKKNAEWAANVTGTVTYTTDYVKKTSGIGTTYKITPIVVGEGRLTSDNYSFNPVDGSLTVVAKALVDDETKYTFTFSELVYNGNDQTPTVTVKDLVLNQNATVSAAFYVDAACTEAFATDNHKAAGTYYAKITGNTNYAATPAIIKSFKIAQKPLAITTLNKKQAYTGVKQTLVYNYTTVKFEGLVDGDKIGGTGDDKDLPKTTGVLATGVSLKVKTSKDVTYVGEGDDYTITAYAEKDDAKVSDRTKIFDNYVVSFFNDGKLTVTPVELTFTLKDQEINIGEDSNLEIGGTYTPTTDNATYLTVTGFVTNDAVKAYPVLTVASEEKTEGSKTYEITADLSTMTFKHTVGTTVTDVPANNYTFATASKSKSTLTVNKGDISARPIDNGVVYGDDEAEIFINASTSDATVKAQAAEILKKAVVIAETATDAVTKYPNAGTYVMTLDLNKVKDDANYKELIKNYVIAPFTGTYTITKRDLTKIEIADQTLCKDEAATDLDENLVTFTADGYELTDKDIEKLQTEFKYSAVTTSAITATPTVDAIKIEFDGVAAFSNFNLPEGVNLTGAAVEGKYILGDLTVSAAGVNLTLDANSVATSTTSKTKDIKDADTKKVTVKFANRTLKKQVWETLVLPFTTSVYEVSDKLGYAVVDILDESQSDNNVHMTLHMGEIPANTPFLVKVYKETDLSTITFSGVTIVKPTKVDEAGNPYVEDGNGHKFVGLYDTMKDLTGNSIWAVNQNGVFKELKSVKTDLNATKAYLDLSADAAAKAIIIEEIDGSTTAIETVKADGTAVSAEGWYTLGGVKLQGAPTEKGVYIKDGKKFVIK